MYVKAAIKPKGIALYRITPDSSSDLTVKTVDAKAGDEIIFGDLALKYNGINKQEGDASFTVVDNKFTTESSFDFGLKYWASYVNYHVWHTSGAYAFRQIDNLFKPLPYSELVRTTVSKGDFVQKFTLYYEKTVKKQNVTAIVHVMLDHDFQVVKVDVDLNSLPDIYLNGYEVVSVFQAVDDFDNNGEFWTDSNGLEMQRRQLNYRSYYNITDRVYSITNLNITANYYPINSAISMKEHLGMRQFTVMNDKSQGGSSLAPGRIEFMQNRRIPCDDNKGVVEWLNETDASGNGIRVPATYYVQLSYMQDRPSQQRLVQ